MELILPLLGSAAAFGFLVLALLFKYIYDEEEAVYLMLLISTIAFFVSGAMWLGVTHVNPATGAIVNDDNYNFMTWLLVIFGFIPILLLYETAFEAKKEG